MGLLWLSTVPLTNALVAQIYGLKHVSMLSGAVFFGHQIGGFLRRVGRRPRSSRATGSYDLAWWISIGLGRLRGDRVRADQRAPASRAPRRPAHEMNAAHAPGDVASSSGCARFAIGVVGDLPRLPHARHDGVLPQLQMVLLKQRRATSPFPFPFPRAAAAAPAASVAAETSVVAVAAAVACAVRTRACAAAPPHSRSFPVAERAG